MKKATAIQFFGTQTNLARFLTEAGYRVSQPAVSKWPDVIPELWAYRLESLTNGKLAFSKDLVSKAA